MADDLIVTEAALEDKEVLRRLLSDIIERLGNTVNEVAEAAVKEQIAAAGGITSYFSDDAPALTKLLVIGDLWFDTDDNKRPYRYDGTEWVEVRDGSIAIAQAEATDAYLEAVAAGVAAGTAQNTADGKSVAYYSDTAPTGLSALDNGDLWIDWSDGNKLYSYSHPSWIDTQDAGISQAIIDAAIASVAAGNAQDTADGKIATYYQTSAPTGLTSLDNGDLWFDTDDGNKLHLYEHPDWTEVQDQAIIAAALTANWGNVQASSIKAPADYADVTGDHQAGSVAAADIIAGTIVGSTIKTSLTGERIEMSALTDHLIFYNSSGVSFATIGLTSDGPDGQIGAFGTTSETNRIAINAKGSNTSQTLPIIQAVNSAASGGGNTPVAIYGQANYVGIFGDSELYGVVGSSDGAGGAGGYFQHQAAGVPLIIAPGTSNTRPTGTIEHGSLWVPNNGDKLEAYINSGWKKLSYENYAGYCTSTGVMTEESDSGFSSTRVAAGHYRVTMPSDAASNWSVSVNAMVDALVSCTWTVYSSTVFNVYIRNSGGTLTDHPFSFMVKAW